MSLELMHPRDQIVMLMERIYGYGMTTTSGGNLSVLDDEGAIWITPAGVAKGTLRPEDIVCVRADGSVQGIHRPSSELPFHKAVYAARADVRGVLHAHPPALVTFSIVRQIPDTRIIPSARFVCGPIGYAEYALPGSDLLGARIAAKFAEGFAIVLLENHGVVAAGESLFQAFQRFETLDFCARLIIEARRIGTVRTLQERHYVMFGRKYNVMPEFVPVTHSSRERELRAAICGMLHRAYGQRLVTSTEGTFSARTAGNDFLITPYGADRKYVQPEDLVMIAGGRAERGKTPSRSVRLHQRIYELHADIGAVMIAHPPAIMAFAVSDAEFDSRTIPEAYIVLRDIPELPYGSPFLRVEEMAAALGARTPVVLVENDCILTTGAGLLEAYDRLEVAEFSAKALIAARAPGDLAPITEAQVRELARAFKLAEPREQAAGGDG